MNLSSTLLKLLLAPTVSSLAILGAVEPGVAQLESLPPESLIEETKFCVSGASSISGSIGYLSCKTDKYLLYHEGFSKKLQLHFLALQTNSERLQVQAEAKQRKFEQMQLRAQEEQHRFQSLQAEEEAAQRYFEDLQYVAIFLGDISVSLEWYSEAQKALTRSQTYLRQAQEQVFRSKNYQSHANAYRRKAEQHRLEAERFLEKAESYAAMPSSWQNLHLQPTQSNKLPSPMAIDLKQELEVAIQQAYQKLQLLGIQLQLVDVDLLSAYGDLEKVSDPSAAAHYLLAERAVVRQDIDVFKQELQELTEIVEFNRETAKVRKMAVAVGIVIGTMIVFAVVVVLHVAIQLTQPNAYDHFDPISRGLFDSLPEELRAELMVFCEELHDSENTSFRKSYLSIEMLLGVLWAAMVIYLYNRLSEFNSTLRF